MILQWCTQCWRICGIVTTTASATTPYIICKTLWTIEHTNFSFEMVSNDTNLFLIALIFLAWLQTTLIMSDLFLCSTEQMKSCDFFVFPFLRSVCCPYCQKTPTAFLSLLPDNQPQHIFIELTRYLINTQMYGMHFRIPNKSTLHVWPLDCCRAPCFSFLTSSCASFFMNAIRFIACTHHLPLEWRKHNTKMYSCVCTLHKRYVHARANRNLPRNLDSIFIKCCGICQSIFQFESYAQPYIPSTDTFFNYFWRAANGQSWTYIRTLQRQHFSSNYFWNGAHSLLSNRFSQLNSFPHLSGKCRTQYTYNI